MKRQSLGSSVRKVILGLGCLVLATLFGATAPAGAGIILPPGLTIAFNDHAGGPPDFINPPGLEIAQNRFRYTGSHTPEHGRWSIEWEIEADPDPFLKATFTITNNLPSAQDFTLSSDMPISLAITVGSLTGGSFSGALLDTGGGATLESLSGGSPPPMYMAIIDGTDYQALATAPQTFTADPYETNSFDPFTFGAPIPSQAGPNVLSDIEIELNVRLSGGDEAALVATFVVEPVPEPATLTFLGAGVVTLFAIRRRRAAR